MKMKTPSDTETDTDSEPTTDIDITMTPEELSAVVDILKLSGTVFTQLSEYFSSGKDGDKAKVNYQNGAAISQLLHDQFASIASKIETKQRVLH